MSQMEAAPAPPAGTGKGKRKRPLSEDDVYLVLHRYAPATILTALQEVAQHAEGRRIDWKALVGKSATGITSAREYQMLWRHLAYQHELAESFDAGASPLDDDSDLECELEPVPNPSKEALSEASLFAKILISGSSREQASSHRVNLEVPVQNSPNEKIVRVPCDKQLAQSQRLTNVTGLISNSKQASQIGPSPDPLEANGASKKKKKIKTWSKEEDADLAAGVQKYGEGNWEIILDKCNFRTRTSDQLSQRWALICKRPGSSKSATSKQVSITSSEERMATQKALSMAVDYNPCTRKLSALRSSGVQQHSIQHTSTAFGPTIHEVKSAVAPSTAPRQTPVSVPMQMPDSLPLPVTVQVQAPLPQGKQAPAQAGTTKASNASNKTRSNTKKQAVLQNPNTTSSIQAAAIAAGGRIATPVIAANHLKATQSKNAVHIRTRVTVSSKSSMSSKGLNMVVEPRTQLDSAEHLETPNTVTPISDLLTTHTAQQIIDVSEVAAANPPVLSSGAHFKDTKKALSVPPVPTSCNTEEQDETTFCSVTMDDLFPEDANQSESLNPKEKQSDTTDPNERQHDTVDPKQAVVPKAKQPDTVNPKVEGIVDSKDADMLEFDQFVASQGGASVNMDPDKSNTVKSAPMTQCSAGGQKKQLKSVPAAGRGTSVCAGASTSVRKNKTPVPHPVTLMPTGTLQVNVSAAVTAQNKTMGRKAPAPAAAGGQNPLMKKQAPNTIGNQLPNNVAIGATSVVLASSQASSVVNVAGKVNAPGSSQASMYGAGKANPPGNSQASTLVNSLRKVNPPGSSQASTAVNGAIKASTPGSGQASTAVNGASKVSTPGSGQASTAVNGASKANPPGSGQESMAVNGASKASPPPPGSGPASMVVNGVRKANPPGSIQAIKVVNGASKANPPAIQ